GARLCNNLLVRYPRRGYLLPFVAATFRNLKIPLGSPFECLDGNVLVDRVGSVAADRGFDCRYARTPELLGVTAAGGTPP
ncbi:MAG: hypothetical protein V5A34_02050, partial [Halapricum sp.]